MLRHLTHGRGRDIHDAGRRIRLQKIKAVGGSAGKARDNSRQRSAQNHPDSIAGGQSAGPRY